MKLAIVITSIIVAGKLHIVLGFVGILGILAYSLCRASKHNGMSDEEIEQRWRDQIESEKSNVMVDEDGSIDWESVKF